MMKYTPLQTLAKVNSQLWWNIRLVGSIEVQLDEGSASWNDLVEIEKVLRCTVAQLEVVIRREREKEPNQGNLRQAREFALKASVAKASGDAPAHRQLCPGGPSHK